MTTITIPEHPTDARRASPILLPHHFAHHCTDHRYKVWPHIAHCGLAIAQAIARGNGRLIVNLPPGLGKSTLFSVWVPLWFLKRWPDRRVMVGGHGSNFASQWGRLVKNECERNPLVGIRLADDSQNKSRWHTADGGGMTTVGVGEGAMGWRSNLWSVDDPYPNFDAAYSEVWRRELESWMHGTVMRSLEPGGTVIIVNHRMATDDLTAYLVETMPGEWTVIRLPALAEANDPLGRQPGEAICPARYDRAYYEHRRTITPPEQWEAMYQQNPSATGIGSVYHRFGEWNLGEPVLRRDLPIGLCLDFNINPGMHAEAFQYDSKRDHFTVLREFHGPRLNVIDLCRRFVEWRAKCCPNHEVQLFGDASGSAEKSTDGRSDWAVVESCLSGLKPRPRVRVPAKNPPVVDRVNALNDALRDTSDTPHVTIDRGCGRLIADLRLMRRGADGQPEKSNQHLSHSSEAVGYAVHYLRPVGGRIEIPKGRFIGI